MMRAAWLRQMAIGIGLTLAPAAGCSSGSGGSGGGGTASTGTTTSTGTGGATSSSSTTGIGGNPCEPGGAWCTCEDTTAYHCVCTCTGAPAGGTPVDLPAADAAACAAHDGQACDGSGGVDAGTGALSCQYQTLPWCGI